MNPAKRANRSKEVLAQRQSETFKAWYEANKTELAAKRKNKYDNDSAYREKARAAAQAYRATRRVESPVYPEGHEYTFQEAADALGTSIGPLREWRKKNYYPEPTVYKGSFFFTSAQIGLLQNLKDFFDLRGYRISAAKKPDLEALISIVYANWN